MDEIKEFTIKLTLTKRLGPRTIISLVDKYNGIYGLFRAYKNNLLEDFDLANLDIQKFEDYLHKRNIKFVCFWEESYPSILKECEDYPIIIYSVGNQDLLNRQGLISIVGTRAITNYGKGILDELIPNLNGATTVSGMAFGVDAYVHKLSIKSGLPTIAVLPFSPDNPIPQGNSALYREIVNNNGLIISEFPSSIKTHTGQFPRRNRIIAGLSKRTVVIEAGIKSGALITADIAFSYNREVYAYPGRVADSMSKGCNYLIKNNIATLIESSKDLGFLPVVQDKIANLSEVERNIYYAILPEPKSINDLANILGLDIKLLSQICTNLEINGILNTDNQNEFYVS